MVNRVRRGVRPLLAASGISAAGDGAFNTAAPLIAASLTSDPVAVAAVTAAVHLPWLIVGLPAGALVDRWPLRPVMIYANLFQAGVLVLFAVVMVFGQPTIPTLVTAVVLVTVGQCFFGPAAQSAMPHILGKDRKDLVRANGKFFALDGVGRTFVGPLGGAWSLTVNRIIPIGANAISFIVSAALLSRLPELPVAPGPHEKVVDAVRTGFRQIARIPELLILTLGSAALNIGYFAAIAPLALYTRDVLGVGEVGYGALFAVLSTAVIATSWFGTEVLHKMSSLQARAVTLAVSGAAWLVIAFVADIWVTGLMFACIGSMAALGSVNVISAFQRLAPEGSLARLLSIHRLTSVGASGVGALAGGWTASGLGLAAPLAAGGAVSLAAAVAVWFVRHHGTSG